MLTENDVIEAVCKHLESEGFVIESTANTNQHGPDIVAKASDGSRLVIEAKGATSSKEGTNRYGIGFNRSQSHSHISRALFETIKARDNLGCRVGMALPAEKNHLEFINSIKKTLQELNIKVYWVDENHKVL